MVGIVRETMRRSVSFFINFFFILFISLYLYTLSLPICHIFLFVNLLLYASLSILSCKVWMYVYISFHDSINSHNFNMKFIHTIIINVTPKYSFYQLSFYLYIYTGCHTKRKFTYHSIPRKTLLI
jgi:hypothetical protein